MSFGTAGPGPPLIIVDDTDPSITYSGDGWFLAHGSNSTLGNSGSVYNSTQHGTSSPGSISFRFIGTYVHVFGTSTTFTTSNSTISPSWECFIDGISIGVDPLSDSPQNGWSICDSPHAGLPATEHLLTINVTPNGGVFWLDSIWLQFASGVPVDNAVIEIDDGINVSDMNNAITYSPNGWTSDFWSHKAINNGARATVIFWGGSLSWYGLFVNNQFPSSSGQYSIDGGPQVPFQINGSIPWASNQANVTNQLIFTVSNLVSKSHTLDVTYLGNPSLVPLSLDYLFIQNGTSSSPAQSSVTVSASSSTNSPSSSPLSTPTPSPEKASAPIGAIIGGVVGGVSVMTLLLGLLLFLRRCRNQYHRRRFGLDGVFRQSTPPPIVTPLMLSGDGFRHPSFVEPSHTIVSAIASNSMPSRSTPSSSLPPAPTLASHSDSTHINAAPSAASPPIHNSPGASKGERERLQLPSNRHRPAPPAASGPILHHEDSGIRLPQNEPTIVEVPPQYTID